MFGKNKFFVQVPIKTYVIEPIARLI